MDDLEGFIENGRAAQDAVNKATWPLLNRERGELIDKHIAGTITPTEQQRLDLLQSLADEHLWPRTDNAEAVEEATRMFCGHSIDDLASGDEGTNHCRACEREHREMLGKVLWCDIHEAKPNPMFTEQQRALVRFLRYDKSVPCAECGKRKKAHWTMLCSFEAKSMGFLVPSSSGTVHMPLSPVCQDHLLVHAAWTPPPKPSKTKTFKNRLGEQQEQ